MERETIRFIVVGAAGLGFWQLASIALGTHEPWDSPDYVQLYVASLGLCALFGYPFDARAWRWGPVVVSPNFP